MKIIIISKYEIYYHGSLNGNSTLIANNNNYLVLCLKLVKLFEKEILFYRM